MELRQNEYNKRLFNIVSKDGASWIVCDKEELKELKKLIIKTLKEDK